MIQIKSIGAKDWRVGNTQGWWQDPGKLSFCFYCIFARIILNLSPYLTVICCNKNKSILTFFFLLCFIFAAYQFGELEKMYHSLCLCLFNFSVITVNFPMQSQRMSFRRILFENLKEPWKCVLVFYIFCHL